MFWFTLCLILLAALAALCLFRLYLDRIWQRDLRYLNRHEHGRPSENGPSQDIKTVWGAKPNFNSSRAETREADESRAVYERTVEKLRELSPKRYRRLKPEIPPEHDNHDSLPIFSAQAAQTPEQAAEKEQETAFQTASEDGGAAVARPDGEPAAERITEDETGRRKRQSVQEIIAEEFARTGEAEQADAEENPSAAADPAEAAPHAPDPDAPVITPDEIGRFKRKSVQEIIEEEFARTREGEAAKDGENSEPETEAPPHAPAPDAPVITEAELGRFKREPAESIIEKTSPEAETRKPAPDAQIITLEELQRAQSIRQNRRPAPAPVAVDDPVFAGVRERAELRRIERDN
ncbi:TPA: cell division protein FtsK, partial [Neisseria bacilliformis]